jgi:hypothetical protein
MIFYNNNTPAYSTKGANQTTLILQLVQDKTWFQNKLERLSMAILFSG